MERPLASESRLRRREKRDEGESLESTSTVSTTRFIGIVGVKEVLARMRSIVRSRVPPVRLQTLEYQHPARFKRRKLRGRLHDVPANRK